MDATETTFPLDYAQWQRQWYEWKDSRRELLGRDLAPAFGPKNFLADEIIGTHRIGTTTVEFSSLTMPDFGAGYGADPLRLVGITYQHKGGEREAGPVVRSLAELETAIEEITG